jgi:shikimate kinase
LLVLLVGPKGSGKSHVGRLLEARLGVRFFHVEPLWMEYHAECDREGRTRDLAEGAERVVRTLSEELRVHRTVCVETTGASAVILASLVTLVPEEERVCVRVEAPLDVCLERIRRRDPTDQIPMKESMIRRVHEQSRTADVPYDIRLENVSLSEDEVIEALLPWLGAGHRPLG